MRKSKSMKIDYLLHQTNRPFSIGVPPREAHERVATFTKDGFYHPGDEIELRRLTEEVVGVYTVQADGTVTYRAKP